MRKLRVLALLALGLPLTDGHRIRGLALGVGTAGDFTGVGIGGGSAWGAAS